MLHTLGTKHRQIKAFAFVPRSTTLLTADSQGDICRWDVATGQMVDAKAVLSLHSDVTPFEISCIALSDDGTDLLVGGKGWVGRAQFTARICVIKDFAKAGERPVLWCESLGWLEPDTVAFHPANQKLVIATFSGRYAEIFDSDMGKPIGLRFGFWSKTSGGVLSPNCRTLICITNDGHTDFSCVFGLPDLQPTYALGDSAKRVNCLAFSPDGKYLVTGGAEGVQWWDAREFDLLDRSFKQDGAWTQALAFNASGEMLAAVHPVETRNVIHLLKTGTGELLGQVEPPLSRGKRRMAVAFSSDGKYLLTLQDLWGEKGGECLFSRWDLATRKPVYENRVGISMETLFGFSPSGKYVYFTARSSDGSQSVRLIDTSTAKVIDLPTTKEYFRFRAVGFGPGDKRLAALNQSFTLRIDMATQLRQWDLETGRPLHQGVFFPDTFTFDFRPGMAAYTKDGNILVAHTSGVLRFIESKSGLPLGPAIVGGEDGAPLALSPNGRWAATTSSKGVQIWPVPQPMRADTEHLRLWIQTATGLQLDADGTLTAMDHTTYRKCWEQLQKLGTPPR
jgi:WD40 repeat protein